jgi:S1-C subfamily serine protease
MRTLAVAVFAACLAAPQVGHAESLGELYCKVSTTVVVIRAKGREVSTGGVVRFDEIGSGVLVSQDDKVVTAAHGVHGMDDITVEFLGEDRSAAG